jgi:hypothetical protein
MKDNAGGEAGIVGKGVREGKSRRNLRVIYSHDVLQVVSHIIKRNRAFQSLQFFHW